MKTLVLAALAALLAAPAFAADKPAAAAANANDKPAAAAAKNKDAALQAVLNEYDAAWGKGDAKAISALYTEDATVVTSDGTTLKGRAAVESAMASMLSEVKGSQSHHTVATVRWIGKNDAFTDIDATFDNMPSAPKFHAVILFHQQGGKWLMEDARSYDLQSDAAAPASTPASSSGK